ncbi:MAG: VanZ family protein [bacterium]|nr:VanZ family protein [bacterium]
MLRKKLAYLDKLQHLGAYAILTFILYFALKFQNRFWLLKEHPASFAFIFAFSIGFLIEFNQILLPSRTFNKYDLLANTLGSTLTILIIKFSVKIFKVIKESI